MFSLTFTDPTSSEYNVVSGLNCLSLSLNSESIRITFCTNAFFPDILVARCTAIFEEKISFGRDKLIAWSNSSTNMWINDNVIYWCCLTFAS